MYVISVVTSFLVCFISITSTLLRHSGSGSFELCSLNVRPPRMLGLDWEWGVWRLSQWSELLIIFLGSCFGVDGHIVPTAIEESTCYLTCLMNIHMKARILGFPADHCIVYGLCYSHQLSVVLLFWHNFSLVIFKRRPWSKKKQTIQISSSVSSVVYMICNNFTSSFTRTIKCVQLVNIEFLLTEQTDWLCSFQLFLL